MVQCNLNCSECELAAGKHKNILVDVIGHEPGDGMLAFSGRQSVTIEFGEYLICFVNYCGEHVHVGRVEALVNPAAEQPAEDPAEILMAGV